VVGPAGEGVSRDGNVGAPTDVTTTSRVAGYNGLDGLERQPAHGDVSAPFAVRAAAESPARLARMLS